MQYFWNLPRGSLAKAILYQNFKWPYLTFRFEYRYIKYIEIHISFKHYKIYIFNFQFSIFFDVLNGNINFAFNFSELCDRKTQCYCNYSSPECALIHAMKHRLHHLGQPGQKYCQIIPYRTYFTFAPISLPIPNKRILPVLCSQYIGTYVQEICQNFDRCRNEGYVTWSHWNNMRFATAFQSDLMPKFLWVLSRSTPRGI